MSTPDDSKSVITKHDFYREKAYNLCAELIKIDGIQNNRLGCALINAMDLFSQHPEQISPILLEGLINCIGTRQDNSKYLDKDKFERDQLVKAKDAAQLLGISVEEAILPPEAQSLLLKYFECFVDVEYNSTN